MRDTISGKQLYFNHIGWVGVGFSVSGLLITAISGGILQAKIAPISQWSAFMDLPESAFIILGVVMVGLTCLLVGGGIALAHLFTVRRTIRIRDTGVQRKATVVSHFAVPSMTSQILYYRLIWIDENGQEGRSIPQDLSNLTPWPVDAEITIFVDLAKPQHSVWSKDVGAPQGQSSPLSNKDNNDSPVTRRR